MKKVLLIAFVTIAAINVNAQAQKYMNFGGLGTGLYFGMEFPVAAPITIGFIGSTNYSFDNFYVGAKGNFYFDDLFSLTPDWDVYAGVGLGWRINDFGDNDNSDGFSFGAQIGGRWFWNDKWGLNGEFGWSNAALGGIGVTMKM